MSQFRSSWGFAILLHLIFLNLLTSASTAYAVVNGELVASSPHAQALRSVLGVKIRISPCTGSYLGQGRILTAAHCLLLDGYPDDKAKICITDGLGNALACLKPNEYTVTFPEKEKDGPKAPVRGGLPGMGKVIHVPIPDMAMITLNGFGESAELQKAFAEIQPVTLALNGSAQGTDTWIAGQGCDNYVTFEGREVMRFGRAKLDAGIDPSMTSLTWIPGSDSSGACPGDSGGPLFQWGPQGQMVQVGVTSYLKIKSDKNGLSSVFNAFGRIDGASASTWLRKEGS